MVGKILQVKDKRFIPQILAAYKFLVKSIHVIKSAVNCI